MDTTLYIALRFSSLALSGLIAFLFLQIRENRKNKLTFKGIKKILEKEIELGEVGNDCFVKITDRLEKLEEDSNIHEDIIQTIISCVIDLGKANGFLSPYNDDKIDDETDDEIDDESDESDETDESEEKYDKIGGKIMEEGLEILIRKHNNKAGSKEIVVKKPAKKSKKKESKSE